ncbi:MAG: hypothetical protein JO218_04985 [Burkholderiales bacterium]|nr:hypothetical protein [Burkholderiales bacterium]
MALVHAIGRTTARAAWTLVLVTGALVGVALILSRGAITVLLETSKQF